MSDQDYENTIGRLDDQIDELEAQLTALREAARDQLPDVSMRSDVHDKLAALLEVCNEK